MPNICQNHGASLCTLGKCRHNASDSVDVFNVRYLKHRPDIASKGWNDQISKRRRNRWGNDSGLNDGIRTVPGQLAPRCSTLKHLTVVNSVEWEQWNINGSDTRSAWLNAYLISICIMTETVTLREKGMWGMCNLKSHHLIPLMLF